MILPNLLPKGIGCYSVHELDSAPEKQGIYAWYADIAAGVADWKAERDAAGANDLGARRLKQLLLIHSRKFDPSSYRVTARSDFELEWKGTLHPEIASSFEHHLNSETPKTPLDADVTRNARPFGKEKTRAMLVELLGSSSPFFAAPIYIGASENVRRRLKNHIDQIFKLRTLLSKSPEKREDVLEYIKKNPSNFAARAVAAEFSPEQLRVYTLDITQLTAGSWLSSDIEDLAFCIEWFLNRWYRPVTGKL